MGLDITAYSRLELVGKHTDGWCEDEDHVSAYAYDSFPASFRGIEVVATDQNLLLGGCYAVTPQTKTHRFRAGSYGGYNRWREDLARQFNPYRHDVDGGQPDPDLPFYELIWFADNEGCIGELAAIELLTDFREHALAYAPPDTDYLGHYRERYADWTRAFELAADGGLVDFH